MAACFDPLPPGKRHFDGGFPVGRPPRQNSSSSSSSSNRRKAKNSNEICSRHFSSSTYKSFFDPCDDETSFERNPTSCRISRVRNKSNGNNKENESCPDHVTNGQPVKGRMRRRCERTRWKFSDGYSSDSTLLPVSRRKNLPSTLFENDNDFEKALSMTFKSKSSLSIPTLENENPKRFVTFSMDESIGAGRKIDFTRSKNVSMTFEQMKMAPNTIHPKRLYSTIPFPVSNRIHFAGNDGVDNTFHRSNAAGKSEKSNPFKRLPYGPSASLRRRKKVHGNAATSGDRARIYRSRSDGNLTGNSVESLSDPVKGFKEGSSTGKYFRVLNKSWRNLFALGGMSRPSKAAPMAKKVAPPTVPEVFRHSGSSFGSAGYASSEDAFIPMSQPDALSNISDRSDIYGSCGKSPGPGNQFNYQSFTFPGKGVYYHHQQSLQEDQGIDMTQSPGRDSPGSSGSGSGSRHSTASLDSGRASGSHLLGPRPAGSNLSSSPRCSISSSSIVSSEHNAGPGARVERLIQQGIPDQDIIHAWLQDLHFEEYFALFVSAGYDMPTISKMTPEDLTAIGIKKPNHRKKLKAEIAQLNISDGLPEYIPGSMEEWLRLLRLEEYIAVFRQQGYQSVEDVTQLAWEDLEEAGVVKLGHQKRLLLAIKRVKDIRAGKIFSHLGTHTLITQAELHAPSPGNVDMSYRNAMSRSFHNHWDVDATRQILGYSSPYCPDIVPIKIRGGRGKSLESLEDSERLGTHHTFSSENTATFYYSNSKNNCGNNLRAQCGGWRRSYEDGDITPTNEANVALHEGGGTLPRPRGLVRPRPVAKIPATRNTTSHYFEKPSYNIYDAKDFNAEPLKEADLIHNDPSGDLPEKCSVPPSMAPISGIYDYKYRYSVADSSPAGLIHNNPVAIHSAPAMRRHPPSPPKRQSSHPNDIQTSIDCNSPKDNGMIQQTTIVELHTHSSVPLPNYSSPSPSSDLNSQLETLHLNWRSENADQDEEQRLLAALAQVRNGSDASFKSSSSTESDSLPFANENAGTIKQRARCQSNDYPGEGRTSEQEQEPADVLSDIGNMLANLTDELDAMLEEEKRQGLNVD